jgi:hypothetical protein
MKTLLKRTSMLIAWLIGARETIYSSEPAWENINKPTPQQAQQQNSQRPNRICEYIAPDGQTYLWVYASEFRQAILKEIGKLAANPESDFNWHDAAIACKQVRAMDP